jgi:D-beta-D-heptose 7-phosphate kinase/D-beta-D-heptose 1-phosphate adenosyltransferase
MIATFDRLAEIREKHNQERIVFAGGCFDLVHEGHVVGMRFCKAMGDVLVVGVSSDERVRQRKGPGRPVRSELARLAVKPVDYAFIMPMPITDGDTPTIQVIRALRPDVFADHEENRSRWAGPGEQLINELGTELRFNTTDRRDSTTQIVARVAALPAMPLDSQTA